jgi:hypothetical protein
VPSGFDGLEHWPVCGSQVPALWHSSCAVQVTAVPPTHEPLSQTDPCVQSWPSSHNAPSLPGSEQNVAHTSEVPSHTRTPGTLPSVQALPMFGLEVYWQVPLLQAFTPHWPSSGQSGAVSHPAGVHSPASQVWFSAHAVSQSPQCLRLVSRSKHLLPHLV